MSKFYYTFSYISYDFVGLLFPATILKDLEEGIFNPVLLGWTKLSD